MYPCDTKLNMIDVPEDLHEKAINRAGAVLKKIDEVRKSLELPIEQLPIVIEIYRDTVMALMAEASREDIAKRTKRVPLTLQTPTKIKPGSVINVIGRPQWSAFRPEDLAIHGDRSRWMVHDIVVGNNSQFEGQRQAPAAGTEFGPGGICEHLRFETCQTAMDLGVRVEYVGPEAEGELFEATFVGTAVQY